MNFLYFSDANPQGSGYWTICRNISQRLVARGHSVVVLGLNYKKTPHNYPFRLVPTDTRILRTQIETIKQSQWPDVLIMAHDVPYQVQFTSWFAGKGVAQYVGLFPVEAGPLKEIREWTDHIQLMDKGLVISEFGQRECVEAGLINTSFLPVGIDSFWHTPDPDYREVLRKDIGLDGKFVVMTVGANHLRKNLSAGIQIMSQLKARIPNVHYLLIAEPTPRTIGWSLPELAERYGLENNISVILNRPTDDALLRFYQASDAYLCTSHAEGLGLPLLESMACGLPVVAGNWTAMTELLDCGRGILVDSEYGFIDPFGNNNRYFISVERAVEALEMLYNDKALSQSIREKALFFVQSRTFDRATDVLLTALR